jgi:hypothetical protein
MRPSPSTFSAVDRAIPHSAMRERIVLASSMCQP